MASTEPAARAEALAALDAATLAMLGELVLQSQWNQTDEDWALFAREGRIHVVRDAAQQRIVASGAVLPMGAHDAWISMILVDPASRGRGLGRTVFEACLQDLERQGRSAWLDATPAGEALYVQYGFEPLWRLARWQREPRPATGAPLPQGRASSDALEALAALDAQALGQPRPAVLQDLALREGSQLLRDAQGFAIVRRGRVAHHIGPLIASDDAAALRLLEQACGALDGQLFIDVPDARAALRERLAQAGFSQQRPFARMRRGGGPVRGHSSFIHAVAGPEYG
ncbi:GNAT family N-acetyltransferase [Xenophilus arseniciresistens]|uniref:GNAT family N-acetyltransferase n=1 Tax=Xenophilus arseniciresistens TaxID=1283306 RepID=A0AAE3T073_9BURK|nr:GNAT family N-acetyltransferase [Xenophilus arseniciresistens]MDA7417829.1 GNAT family N-acetyltransferase [Xenophilus arseniciresistens]